MQRLPSDATKSGLEPHSAKDEPLLERSTVSAATSAELAVAVGAVALILGECCRGNPETPLQYRLFGADSVSTAWFRSGAFVESLSSHG